MNRSKIIPKITLLALLLISIFGTITVVQGFTSHKKYRKRRKKARFMASR